jgi:hypothetical protein
LLRELDMRPPFDVSAFCRRLAEQRGRPIRLQAHPIPAPGPFGVWVHTSAEDVIVYQEQTSRLHQVHIVLHEVGHIIAGHGSDEDDDEVLRMLHPSISPDVVRRWLRRSDYSSPAEIEAEKIATIILEWAWELDTRAPELPTSETGRRLRRGLSDHVGWM